MRECPVNALSFLRVERIPTEKRLKILTVSNIPGYVLVNNNCEFSSCGGVGLFIKLEHNFKIRDDSRIDYRELIIGDDNLKTLLDQKIHPKNI